MVLTSEYMCLEGIYDILKVCVMRPLFYWYLIWMQNSYIVAEKNKNKLSKHLLNMSSA